MAAPQQPVGVVGYGAYFRASGSLRVKLRVCGPGRRGAVDQKAVAGPDEDTITMTIEAARGALRRAGASTVGIWKPYGSARRTRIRSSLPARSSQKR